MITIVIVTGMVLFYVMRDLLYGNIAQEDKTYSKVKGNIVHSDEPLICPLCGRGFYRWEWAKAYKRDPEFRAKYYNHVLEGGTYRLPCPDCAQTRKKDIKRINGEAWNEGARQWNKLTQKERKEMYYQNYMATTSATPPEPEYFPNRKLWKPGDD